MDEGDNDDPPSRYATFSSSPPACSWAATAHAAGEPAADPVAAAIGSSERPADDRSQDAWRQPAAVPRLLRREAGLARHRHLLRRRLLHRTAVAHRRSQGRGHRLQQSRRMRVSPPRRSPRATPATACPTSGRSPPRSMTLTLEPGSLDARDFRDVLSRPVLASGRRKLAQDRPEADALQAARGAQGRRRGGRAGSRRQSRRRHQRIVDQAAPHRPGGRPAGLRGGGVQVRR